MPPPPASGPDEPPGLSSREREILAGIENHLDASAPGLAREMARPLTAAPPVPPGVVEAGFGILSLFAVLAVAGLVPGVVWAALAIMATARTACRRPGSPATTRSVTIRGDPTRTGDTGHATGGARSGQIRHSGRMFCGPASFGCDT